jgi:hypothetical protein
MTIDFPSIKTSRDVESSHTIICRNKKLHKTIRCIHYNNDKWTFELSDSTDSTYQPDKIECGGFKFDKNNMYAIVVQENKSYYEMAIKEPQNPYLKIEFTRFKQSCYRHLSLNNTIWNAPILQFETEDQCIFILPWQNELLSFPFSTTMIAVHPRRSLFKPVLFPDSMTPNSQNMSIVLWKNGSGNWVFVIIPPEQNSSSKIRLNFECSEFKFTDNKLLAIHKSVPLLIDTDTETRNTILSNLQELSKVSSLYPIKIFFDTLTHYTYLTCLKTANETSFTITSSQEDPSLCPVCMQRRKTIQIKPCKHVCLCSTCFDKIHNANEPGNCPMCRSKITGMEEVSFPSIEKWHQDEIVQKSRIVLGHVSNPYIIRI